MSSTKNRGLALALVAVGALVGYAEQLTLTGSAPAIWDMKTSCWTNSAGTACTFADGDDALIDDSIFTGGKVTFDARVTPASVTFNVKDSLVLTNSAYNYGFGKDVLRVTKKGHGTLNVSTYDNRKSSNSNGNLNTGRVDVVEGTLTGGTIALNLFGWMNGSFDVYVHPNATYLASKNWGGYGDSACGMNLIVQTNGTHRITTTLTFLQSLTVNGGTLDWSAGTSSGGPLVVKGKLAVGPAPQSFVLPWPDSNPTYFGIGFDPPGGGICEVRVEDVTGDERPDAVFSNYFMRVTTGNRVGWRKTGPGHMVYSPKRAPSNGSRYTVNGDIRIEEGVLELTRPGSICLDQDNEVYVSTNATMLVDKGRVFFDTIENSSDSYFADEHNVKVTVDHGTLKLSDHASNANADFACGYLTLDHSTFDYSELKGSALNVLFQLGGFKYLDDHPLELALRDGNDSKRSFFRLYDTHPTEFYVGQTDGEAYDLSIKMPVADAVRGKGDIRRSGFVKKGPGRMLLDYRTNKSTSNTFSGDIDVQEGELIIASGSTYAPTDGPASYWGDISGANGRRTVTIRPNGTVRINARYTTGTIEPIDNALHGLDFEVRGGTLIFGNNPSTQKFANLTLAGGTVAVSATNPDYPTMLVAGILAFGGEEPTELPAKAMNGAACTLMLNGSPETVIDVADVTRSAAADAVIAMPLTGHPSAFDDDGVLTNGCRYGFSKCGAGTLRLTGGKIKDSKSRKYLNYNGDATVLAGTLQVDGDVSRSDAIRVSAGAVLAGTGTVNNVVLTVGAGLRLTAGETHALKVQGGLTLPENGIVYIDGDTGSKEKTTFMTFSDEADLPDDFSCWTFVVNGIPVANGEFKLTRRGNALTVGRTAGMVLILR